MTNHHGLRTAVFDQPAAAFARRECAGVELSWIPALQKDTRNVHASTAIEGNPLTLWEALEVSRQGAMDLLRPLIEAGLVEKIGTKKSGRYVLR